MLPHKRVLHGYITGRREGGARIGRDNGTSVVSLNVFGKKGEEGGTRSVRIGTEIRGGARSSRGGQIEVDVPVEGDVLSRSLNSFAGRRSLRGLASWNSGSKF